MAFNKQLDPISRIEGHLGVELEVAGGSITSAKVHGNLWRGFENFLVGREANDAITFTQRICGVCPVPHGQTSTNAVEAAMGYNDNFATWETAAYAVGSGKGVPPAAVHMRNLVLGAEFLMSSITHFYHLAAISYVKGPGIPPWTPYFNSAYYNALLTPGAGSTGPGILPGENYLGFSESLWSATIKQYVKALRIRRLTFEAGALFAGRMPMTSSFVAGGVTMPKASADDKTATNTAKCTMYFNLMQEVADFIVKEYVPITLALGALYLDFDNTHNGGQGYGAGAGNFLAWGGFPLVDGSASSYALPRGYVASHPAATTAITTSTVEANLREFITYSRYASGWGYTGKSTGAYPGDVTRTVPDRDGGYSWLKAPRYAGNPCEVGPLARLIVADLYPDPNIGFAAAGHGLQTEYLKYAKAVTGGPLDGFTGLNPKMIGVDLAVALLQDKGAKLASDVLATGAIYDWDGSSHGVSGGVSGLALGTVAAAYDHASTVIVDGDAVPVASWVIGLKGGLSTMDRLRARSLESLYLVQQMIGAYGIPASFSASGVTSAGGWVAALSALGDSPDTFVAKDYPAASTGTFGAAEAPRGALMHFCSIDNGVISAYQCIVPTTWNASPGNGTNDGPMEQAIIGAPYSGLASSYDDPSGASQSAEDGVEALRIAQSFDPCIACAVH